MGASNAFMAEILDAWEGLNLAGEMSFRRVHMELDSLKVVRVHKGDKKDTRTAGQIVRNIKTINTPLIGSGMFKLLILLEKAISVHRYCLLLTRSWIQDMR